MLQIGVHHADPGAIGDACCGDDRSAKPAHALFRSALHKRDADGRVRNDPGDNVGGVIVAVIREDDLQRHAVGERFEAVDEQRNVARLVLRRDNDRNERLDRLLDRLEAGYEESIVRAGRC